MSNILNDLTYYNIQGLAIHTKNVINNLINEE